MAYITVLILMCLVRSSIIKVNRCGFKVDPLCELILIRNILVSPLLVLTVVITPLYMYLSYLYTVYEHFFFFWLEYTDYFSSYSIISFF